MAVLGKSSIDERIKQGEREIANRYGSSSSVIPKRVEQVFDRNVQSDEQATSGDIPVSNSERNTNAGQSSIDKTAYDAIIAEKDEKIKSYKRMYDESISNNNAATTKLKEIKLEKSNLETLLAERDAEFKRQEGALRKQLADLQKEVDESKLVAGSVTAQSIAQDIKALCVKTDDDSIVGSLDPGLIIRKLSDNIKAGILRDTQAYVMIAGVPVYMTQDNRWLAERNLQGLVDFMTMFDQKEVNFYLDQIIRYLDSTYTVAEGQSDRRAFNASYLKMSELYIALAYLNDHRELVFASLYNDDSETKVEQLLASVESKLSDSNLRSDRLIKDIEQQRLKTLESLDKMTVKVDSTANEQKNISYLVNALRSSVNQSSVSSDATLMGLVALLLSELGIVKTGPLTQRYTGADSVKMDEFVSYLTAMRNSQNDSVSLVEMVSRALMKQAQDKAKRQETTNRSNMKG